MKEMKMKHERNEDETLDERKKTLDKMEESGRTNENKREAQRKKKRKKWRSLEEGVEESGKYTRVEEK